MSEWINIEKENPPLKTWVLCKVVPPVYDVNATAPQPMPEYLVARRMDMPGLELYKLPYGGIMRNDVKVIAWHKLPFEAL
jgi:hypothetical protein